MADVLELLDYISLAAVLAVVPLLHPEQDRGLRRLAWMPIVCVGVWFALAVILYLGRAALGESYAWIVGAGLVSIVCAILGGAAFLVWSVWGLLLSAESRRTLVPYLAYACCVAAIGTGILIVDRGPGVVAVAMIGCAVIGLIVKWLGWSRSTGRRTSTGPTDSSPSSRDWRQERMTDG